MQKKKDFTTTVGAFLAFSVKVREYNLQLPNFTKLRYDNKANIN